MGNISLKTKYSIGQEVYYAKSVPRKILVCATCNTSRNEYRRVVVKAKIKDISFAGSVKGKAQKTTYSYMISNGMGYAVAESELYATREAAEAKREHKKGIY
jgi:hypothetical protein